MYTVRGDRVATARLDRWYLSTNQYRRVRRLITTAPYCRTDHDAVILQLADILTSERRTSKHPPRLRYPLPDCARDAVYEVGESILESVGTALISLPADQSASGWDSMKIHLRRDCLVELRAQQKLATRRYRRQMKRLADALRDAKRDANTNQRTVTASVEDITQAMSALSLDPAARYRAIRRDIIRLQTSRLTRTRQNRNASHAGRVHESMRAFFRRISIKLMRRQGAVLPKRPGSSLGTADLVGRDWVPIIQKPPCDSSAQDKVFAILPPKPNCVDPALDEHLFTTEAVVKAIRACPRGKASGPDGLPNDWYKEHIDTVAPILAQLFAQWYKEDTLPDSFKDASIYAKILLTRIRTHVPALVSSTQYGFVKGRQVHDAIDVWSALQRRAAARHLPGGALAILLDFAKAYDSLDRAFLTRALRRHGLPSSMITAIEQMHLGTTAAFVVDGQVSATFDVTTGIRHGCPLAPTLFVLAVDVLYDLVNATPGLPGLSLSDTVSVSIVGFADDTSIYLRSQDELTVLREVLTMFGNASGLCVNVEKSTAVFLSPESWAARRDLHGFPVADLTQHVRYLGAQISTDLNSGHVWDVTFHQLRTRLHLAELKTTDILQRIQVCQAVILPKLLFVARHAWPTAELVARMQDFVNTYAWHGVLHRKDRKGRAWMNDATATAERQHGGLQLPSVRDALLILSATTLQRWHSAKDRVAKEVGAVLAATNTLPAMSHIAAGRGPDPAPRMAATLAATGHSVLRGATAFPWGTQERAAVLALLPQAGRAPLRDGCWIDGWYQRDYLTIKGALNEIRAIQRTRAGRLNLHALLRTRVLGSETFCCTPLEEHSGPPICPGSNGTKLQFRLKGHEYPYDAANSFRLLCDSLVFSYPDLLLQHDPETHLVEQGKSSDVWYLQQGSRLTRRGADTTITDLGEVLSLHHAETIARSASNRPSLKFAPHPHLSPVLSLWGTSKLHDKATLRTLISKTKAQHAERDIHQRREIATESSVEFATALDLVGWTAIHHLPHSSSRQRLLFFKIKGLRLSGWDRLHERRGCPHCPDGGAPGGAVYHIVWECPAAQLLWSRLRRVFAALGTWRATDTTTRTDFLTAVFSLRLPSVPPKVWELPTLRKCSPQDGDTGAGPFPVLQALWQQLTLETFLVITAWRNSMTEPTRAWNERQAIAVHATSCHRVLDTLLFRLQRQPDPPEFTAELVNRIHGLLDEASEPPDCQLPTRSPARVLFCAGTTSTNPGPGAILVDLSAPATTPQILWSSAVYLQGQDTTNNQAAFQGLLTGLQAAVDNKWHDLTIISDNPFLLNQLRAYKPPQSVRLRALHHQARRLADHVGAHRWNRHVRSHNAMAIALALHAMETHTTSHVHHPTGRPCHADLPQLLASDLHPWLASQVDPR